MKDTPPTYGSVCSGIEAASIAWEPLGWKPLWFAEIEAFPSAILAHHWPQVPNLGDFTRIKDGIAAGTIEAPDVLVGGNHLNNSVENLVRICRSCHNREHRQRALCTICGTPAKGLGYCEKHYQRFKKWGDPTIVKDNQHTQCRSAD